MMTYSSGSNLFMCYLFSLSKTKAQSHLTACQTKYGAISAPLFPFSHHSHFRSARFQAFSFKMPETILTLTAVLKHPNFMSSIYWLKDGIKVADTRNEAVTRLLNKQLNIVMTGQRMDHYPRSGCSLVSNLEERMLQMLAKLIATQKADIN
ncbi:hypothetical protein GC090_12895 [Pantoea sp. JZ29]|uniref:hypothetical protein n=1 Tax=Pantoea sp. JZ29 TaxID=2654192 RepID=UPI002B467412|nr:hypothetical protein [Pantoea sp. JZ29]WRH21496.1 hypothetical protein GC090_12895 [Pantoea sp. JZ29]